MITSSMSVPQGDHEDFKFFGTSNISRQDIEQLGGSIDCIFLFFYERSWGGYAHDSRGKSAAPKKLSTNDDSTTLMTNIFYHGWGWFSNCSSRCWFGKCHVDFFLLFICVIDQAWGQEGWILAKFLFAFFRLQDEVEVDKNAKKNPAFLTE